MPYRMWMRASLARRESIRSRTDIKISSFHEDSRNKDCKKVWNEPRALLRAHISQPFPFSFSPSTTPAHSFFFLFSTSLFASLCHSDAARVQGWRQSMNILVRSGNEMMNDTPIRRHPLSTRSPAPFAGILPKRRASRSVSSRGSSMRTVPSVP